MNIGKKYWLLIFLINDSGVFAFIGQILALLVVGFGFWMSTHNDECRRSLTIPVIALGGVIFLMCASHLHPHPVALPW
jgi:hypothetical protein